MLTTLMTFVVLAHPPGWDGEHWGSGWWVWRLGMFLLWFVVIGLLFFWCRRWGWRRWEPSPMERAKGILAERFARGEISAEEYRARMEELGK
jgi:putative membrane protein